MPGQIYFNDSGQTHIDARKITCWSDTSSNREPMMSRSRRSMTNPLSKNAKVKDRPWVKITWDYLLLWLRDSEQRGAHREADCGGFFGAYFELQYLAGGARGARRRELHRRGRDSAVQERAYSAPARQAQRLR